MIFQQEATSNDMAEIENHNVDSCEIKITSWNIQ